MLTITIYESLSACAEGCAEKTGTEQAEFFAFLKGLDSGEYTVRRYACDNDAPDIANYPDAAAAFAEKGRKAFPLILVGSKLLSSGCYPSIELLADALKVGCLHAPEDSECCSIAVHGENISKEQP